MNNQEILDLCNFILNKEQTGKSINEDQISDILNAASLKHFKKLVGLPEEYAPGAPVPRVQYEITALVKAKLSPFSVLMDGITDSLLLVDSYGQATIPANYYYPTGLGNRVSANKWKPIEVVTDAEWIGRLSRFITEPTESNPIANFQNGYIRFAPIKSKGIYFSYLRYPLAPVYDYYIDVNDNTVFMPAGTTHTLTSGETYSDGTGYVTPPAPPTPNPNIKTSQTVDLEWGVMDQLDIVSIMLSMMGVNLRDSVMQYAEQMKNTGV